MIRYISSRLVQSLIVLFGVSIIVFGALHLSGDPAVLMMPPDATYAEIRKFRHAYGFDDPVAMQYLRFLGQALRGNFGTSLIYGQKALPLLLERLPATAMLAGAALAWSILAGVSLGVASARRGAVLDYAGRALTILGQAVPVFWLGPMLILLVAVRWQWFPTSGYGGIAHLVLPAVSLGAYYLAIAARLTRSSVLEVKNRDFVRVAAAKGLGQRRILTRHVLRNALIPLVTMLALQVGNVFGGAVVTETIFAWPGVGRLAVEAVAGRDFPLVQAVTLFSAVIFVLINLTTDLLYTTLDPQIRYW